MIKLTSSSEEYLKNIKESKNLTDQTVLRLWVIKGGCAGMEYQMKLTDPDPNDTVIESNGVKVSIDSDSIPYLEGSTLDYSDDLNDSGFKILTRMHPEAVAVAPHLSQLRIQIKSII